MFYPYWENASESQGRSQVGCKTGLQRGFLFKRRIAVILNVLGKSVCATQPLLFVQWRWYVQDVLRTTEPWCVLWWLNHHNIYSRPTTCYLKLFQFCMRQWLENSSPWKVQPGKANTEQVRWSSSCLLSCLCSFHHSTCLTTFPCVWLCYPAWLFGLLLFRLSDCFTAE